MTLAIEAYKVISCRILGVSKAEVGAKEARTPKDKHAQKRSKPLPLHIYDLACGHGLLGLLSIYIKLVLHAIFPYFANLLMTKDFRFVC